MHPRQDPPPTGHGPIRRLDSSSRLSSTLPPELMAEAARRLGWLGALYAVVGVFGHVANRVILAGHSVGTAFRPADLFFVATAIMGIALYIVSRRGRVSLTRLLDLGLVFYVAGAFGIATTREPGLPSAPAALFGFLPAECLWIVIYPLVVPTPPKQMLVASILAAATGPAAFVLSA